MVPTEYTEPEYNLVRLIEFVTKHAIIRRLNGKPGEEIKINPFRPIEMLIPLVQNHRRESYAHFVSTTRKHASAQQWTVPYTQK